MIATVPAPHSRSHPGTPCTAHRHPRRQSLSTRLPGLALTAAILCLLPTRMVSVSMAAPAAPLAADAPAIHALLEGRMQDAASLLQAALLQNPFNPTAHQLLCRVFYAQNQADPAIRECELAVASTPASDTARASDSRLWLGRAYGMKARHAGPIAGFSLARKVHASFEAAVQLNPSNIDALSDLGEYYVDAPSIVGGGDDKARALAARILPRFPPDAHRILALLAESHKDLPAAEAELKLSIASACAGDGHTLAEAQFGGWIDLARFYQSSNRPDDAVAAVRSALALDRAIPPERAHGPLLVEAAAILTAAHREPALAERCLRDYLNGPSRTDAAPAFKVHLQLSALLAARGQSAEASREAATAAAMAPAFSRSPHPDQGI